MARNGTIVRCTICGQPMELEWICPKACTLLRSCCSIVSEYLCGTRYHTIARDSHVQLTSVEATMGADFCGSNSESFSMAKECIWAKAGI